MSALLTVAFYKRWVAIRLNPGNLPEILTHVLRDRITLRERGLNEQENHPKIKPPWKKKNATQPHVFNARKLTKYF